MIQVCERPARYLEARRLSAEEFCGLARNVAMGSYRPRCEVLRMLAVGEVWGICDESRLPQAALLVLPADADVALAAALREIAACGTNCRGSFLTPPVGASPRMGQLLKTGLETARRHAPGSPVWAVLECTPAAEELVPRYLSAGFALRALRPLVSLAPCYIFTSAAVNTRAEPLWLPLSDATHLALLLSRGWAAIASRTSADGISLALAQA